MRKFEDIDKNFKIKDNFEKDGFTYNNVLDKPFKVYGKNTNTYNRENFKNINGVTSFLTREKLLTKPVFVLV